MSLLKHALLLGTLLLMLYPLLWLVASSLRPTDEILTNDSIIPDAFHWQNYVEGWRGIGGISFGAMLLNSGLVAAVCIIGNVVSCSLTAYAFARLRFRFKSVLFAIMLMTIMLPYHVQVIPQYALFLQLDWIDTYLPLTVPKLLATDAFFIFLMVQFMRTLPRELDEAAIIDGAGFFRIYTNIMLPLILPALITTAIFTFIQTWNDFFSPLIYLTSQSHYTVSLGLRSFLDGESASAYGPMFAMSIVALGPVFGFFLASQRYLINGIATTGLK